MPQSLAQSPPMHPSLPPQQEFPDLSPPHLPQHLAASAQSPPLQPSLPPQQDLALLSQAVGQHLDSLQSFLLGQHSLPSAHAALHSVEHDDISLQSDPVDAQPAKKKALATARMSIFVYFFIICFKNIFK